MNDMSLSIRISSPPLQQFHWIMYFFSLSRLNIPRSCGSSLDNITFVSWVRLDYYLGRTLSAL
ncbi:hypothetical protein HanHA300_Chr04g0123361 [Helianthus annuus]|nr:hypothetical protein HanHA300_Chr04g0123361 [Helianthus annuus]KAJ0595826.1 hypothetical protein HanHA89_Chr04g0135841 [Helianthus annuus]KAJ0756487.1 hypothetical protein HanLR1_Chr04g0127721 [Helianthus annuus]